MTDDAGRRALIQRMWDHADDAVLEFPQSGECFEGLANFKEWRGEYPADVWVVEGTISYNGGPAQPTIDILEFRGDDVIRETIYLAEPWEAPEWRAPWRAAP
jgi:hypothetical protein